ncbi:SusD/RagB family nutrient-binding outer membrane lipoprotein [Paraflavitalea sp. CAU 1676]|uniref:SusD/RagB family nutrient-binding outer membrane lipoprotein n=1 Tax=Paraflavitalea sp. CAU 1676 TaxID=3032598 RepID=UPI0023DBF3A2|nr:SusD/RagB family nutrient-binding outer membrane lipoprotein [Paraflavitalea sp. CAU 1676]MDF2192252.1 SusD/RagB family nutrient-binding outer membrane lipoprotein [Paraflavitalea sp. CAU 1676]
MKKIIGIISVSLLVAGCNKFGDTNVDPTQLLSAATKNLLTNSLQAFPDLTMGNIAGSRLAALYVQHLAEGPYPGPSLYNDRNQTFTAWYAGSGAVTPPSNLNGPLYNLQTIINYNNEGNVSATPSLNGAKDNQIAVARILKAYFFLLMTDRWGDIPYSNALKGAQAFSPTYDKQQDIYTGLFKELSEAVAQIKEGEAGVTGDILFDGDMAAWKRFANTTRMIMALRLSKADPAKGKTEFAAAISAGVITSNAQNILYKFVAGDPNNYNPWYNNYSVSNRNDYAISTTMTNYMTPKNDPRLPIYGEVLGGKVVGLPYGRSAAVNIPSAFSRIGSYFRGQGSAMPIFTYAQVLFCRAEAAKLGYGGAPDDATAETLYKDAIKASWQQYGVFDQTAYDTYIALPEVVYSSATGQEKIITEKWVHAYLNSWEAWNDWRRTGFPKLTAAQDAVDPRGIPLRIGYPTTESSLNKTNYDKAVTDLGGKDDNYAKMWWVK